MNESQKLYAESKKSNTKGHLLYNSMYTNFKNRQMHADKSWDSIFFQSGDRDMRLDDGNVLYFDWSKIIEFYT